MPTGVALRNAREQLFDAAERGLGRIAADAEVEVLAPTLVGAVHLLFTDREGGRPGAGAVRKVVMTVIASVAAEPPR